MPRLAPNRILIASRESRLALTQANSIRDRLASLYPDTEFAVLGMTTHGDRVLDRPLAAIGGKGLFIKELEDALLDGRADLAVHSMKDIPALLPEPFALGAVPARADPRDALVATAVASFDGLPRGARVGTSSLRRQAQLQAMRPDIEVLALRGNLDTRLAKLDRGDFVAIVLAAAGLERLCLAARIRAYLDPETCIPAIGQGALGIEYLRAREDLARLLAPLNDPASAACVAAERAFGRMLGASCETPLGAHATVNGPDIEMRAFVASPDGHRLVRTRGSAAIADSIELGVELARRLEREGARELLAAAEDHASQS